jgi:hypothetical protein
MVLWTCAEHAMRTLVLAVALSVVGTAASAAPRPRDEHVVTIASSSDDSPGVLDAHARKRHGEIVRRALLDVLQRSGADVRHAGIEPRQIDVTIVAWRVTHAATQISVAAELRIVVCDARGRMLSIVTGRATVTAPSRAAPIAALREQALAEAVGAMTRTLQSQLARAIS